MSAINPFFSIVTISFNQDRFLSSCIDSIKNQSFKNFEYIVVDACSTDNTSNVLEKYNNFIDHLIVEKDDGPADGLNKGFKKAKGRYFFYLNADDELEKNALQNAYKYISSNNLSDVYCFDGRIIDINGRHKSYICSTKISPYLFVSNTFKAVQQGTFISNKSFQEAGGFNKKNRVCWDTELIASLLKSGASFKSSRILIGKFRHYAGTITCSNDFDSIRKLEKNRLNSFFKCNIYMIFIYTLLFKPYKHILKIFWHIRYK